MFVQAQTTRMNAILIQELNKNPVADYPVLVQGNVSQIKTFTEFHHGLFKYNCGNICSVILNGSDLSALAKCPFLERIEYYLPVIKTMDDTSIIKSDVLKIHNGAAPLARPYLGKGVTFGLVDTGIDYTHKDFKDSLGKTRVMWLWDQNLTTGGHTPQPFNYGQEWNNLEIDSGLCTHHDLYDVGHGTKVAGVAAGNGNTNPIYKGIAPKTNIIVAALNFSSTGPVVLDGINYVVNKAVALNQPFVLNLSIGDYYGSHDGLDLQAQAINSLFANIPGRCVIAAAGNAGNAPMHLQYTLGTDTNFTFMRNTGTNLEQFYVYADTNLFKQAHFTIGVYDSTHLKYEGNIGFRTITSCLGTTKYDSIYHNGKRIGKISTTADILGGSYELLITITADSIGYFWTLENTGAGKFDSWNFDFLSNGLPTQSQVSKMPYYKRPDTLQTICTSFQCSDEVITVANYTERRGDTCCQQTYYVQAGPYDTLAYDCSRGPTRDLRLKPDITATGNNIITPARIWLCQYIVQNYPTTDQVVTADTMHMKFDGTSSASPVVAGFAALYLEKYPTATNRQIKTAITSCAKADYWTGLSLPSIDWGYGKLDGFNALFCSPMGLSNFQVMENVRIYPVPSNSSVSFQFGDQSADGPFSLKIYNLLGGKIGEYAFAEKKFTISVENLQQGLYLYKIFRGQNIISEGKMIKE